MHVFARIRTGVSLLVEAYGLLVIVVAALFVGAGLVACTSLHGIGVGAIYLGLILFALAQLGASEEPDDTDAGEFGAQYDALRYERQQVDEIRRKAGACERLRIATDAFLRYRASNKALGGHDGLEL